MKNIFLITLLSLCKTAVSMDNPTPEQPLRISARMQRARDQHTAHMQANEATMTNLWTTACTLDTTIAEERAKNAAFFAMVSQQLEQLQREEAQYDLLQKAKLAAQKTH